MRPRPAEIGFDYDKARKSLNVPIDLTIEAMIAIGRPGKNEDLPDDLRAREVPSDRKHVKEFAFEGNFVKS